ncbi:hypothetical protein G4B88_019004 [Cannabis sativa]|uniref:Pentatricopeptide repeat-containing protein n=1 Tax=Cannabis sativa TaxID=3483 RepID=A0A7J6H0K7_CANSA|nr:hypothetical protein G4B88_019004 [Cannabis sativa]
MSANVRRIEKNFQVHSPQIIASESLNFLDQFLPFSSSDSNSSSSLNAKERRKIAVGLSKIVKVRKSHLLKAFSREFSPLVLVRLMELLGCRETAFAFFKLAFRDYSEKNVRSCCVVAHNLAARNLRFYAQDVISCVIARIGVSRSREVRGFMWKGHREFETDSSVLDTLMRSYLNVGMANEALEVLNKMWEVKVRPSASAINVLFKLLLRIGDYGSVWKLFRDMVCKEPFPSNYTFNMLILGFCRKGLLNIGESLLHVMRKFRCEPDVFTYNIVINANCVRGQTKVALKWMRFMIETGCKPSIVTFNTVVNALCKEGNFVEARRLFDAIHEAGVSPNTIIYNTIIDGYVKSGEIGEANILYDEMKNKGISPDGITFNILISGHYKMDLAMEKFMEMHLSGLRPNIVTFNTLIGGYCKAFDIVSAEEFVHRMYASGVDPDIVTHNIYAHGFCRSRKINRAVKMLDELVLAGIVPDTVTYNTLLNGACGDILDKALILTGKLLKMAFVPNVVTTNVLLTHFCKQGMPERALMWGQKLSEISFDFDEITYKIMGRAYHSIEKDANVDVRETSAKGFFLDSLINAKKLENRVLTVYDFPQDIKLDFEILILQVTYDVSSIAIVAEHHSTKFWIIQKHLVHKKKLEMINFRPLARPMHTEGRSASNVVHWFTDYVVFSASPYLTQYRDAQKNSVFDVNEIKINVDASIFAGTDFTC